MQNTWFTKLKAFLLLLGSNPIVAWIVRQVTTCGTAYLITNPFTPDGWQKWAVNGAVFIISGTVHAFDLWLQQQVGNAPSPAPVPAPAPAPTPVTTAQTHIARLKAMLKMVILILGGAFLFSSVAHAGYLIEGNKTEGTAITLPSGSGLYPLPIEGFQVGASLPKPTYGFSLNEDLVWGSLTTVNGATNLAPYLGIGFSIYADAAGPVNGNGPLILMGGLNAIGPDLDLFGMGNGQGLVPTAWYTFDFSTGESKVTAGLTVFASLGPGTVQKLAGQ